MIKPFLMLLSEHLKCRTNAEDTLYFFVVQNVFLYSSKVFETKSLFQQRALM